MNFRSVILIKILLLASLKLPGQVNITFQTFSTSGTTQDASVNSGQKLYSVIGQPTMSGSNDPVATHAGFLQLANYIVVVVDEEAPAIIYNTPNQELNAGSTDNLAVQITDINPIPIARIHYRPIGGDSFQEADLTRVSLGNYTAQVQPSWSDDMGMEYFFTATDAATNPNQSRSPTTGSYYAYMKNASTAFPVSSFGSSVANYRIVALPYSPASNTISSLFDELGEYSNTKWRMATYRNTTDDFAEYPADFTTLERGKGYWLIIKNTVDIGLGETLAPKENRGVLYQMTLKPGWNMMGNPYPVSINWNDVLSLNNDLLISGLQVYNGGWANATDLPAFQGGFVNYSGTADLNIKIPFKGQTSEGGRVSFTNIGSDLGADEWKVDLHIFQSATFNKVGGFGMTPLASNGRDFFDVLNPPRFVNSPEIIFDKEAAGFSPACDMVRTNKEGNWKFYVHGNPGEPSVLQWTDDLGENNNDLFLLDETNLEVIDMKRVNNYSFIQHNEMMDFKIFFGEGIKDKVSPDRTIISVPYPNPALAGQPVAFRIALPESEQQYIINLKLYDMSGKTVNQESYVRTSGIHQIEFKKDLSIGLYLFNMLITNGTVNDCINGKLVVR